jgi:hypothetical protein
VEYRTELLVAMSSTCASAALRSRRVQSWRAAAQVSPAAQRPAASARSMVRRAAPAETARRPQRDRAAVRPRRAEAPSRLRAPTRSRGRSQRPRRDLQSRAAPQAQRPGPPRTKPRTAARPARRRGAGGARRQSCSRVELAKRPSNASAGGAQRGGRPPQLRYERFEFDLLAAAAIVRGQAEAESSARSRAAPGIGFVGVSRVGRAFGDSGE